VQQIQKVRNEFQTEFLKSGKSQLPADALEAFRIAAGQRTAVQKQLVQQHGAQWDAELAAALPEEARRKIAAAEGAVEQLRQTTPDLPRGYFSIEPTPLPPVTHLLKRGKAAAPGPVAPPGLPAVLVSRQPEFPAPGALTSGRRLTLARWIASRDNPLTARVIVNRVWQFHFGTGLVRTPSDFGVMGYAPTHPELLDWLADWFVTDANWSLKSLHRLILSSSTYAMSKQWNDTYGAVDPENELWWRYPYRRLEVEALCDSMLAASGQLNPQMYGPSMYPFIPRQALEGSSDPDQIWKPFQERDASRRTVYAFVKRSLVVPLLEVLDLCDTTRTAAQRNVTSVAPQALSLLNGDFVNRQARHFAARLVQDAGTDPQAQIDLAYRRALSRPPTATEMAALQEFLQREAAQLAEAAPETARQRALEQMCRVIFNLNEFAYPD
jgi:hypothetical protein